MTKLINKGDLHANLYFTIDNPIVGNASLCVISNFDLSEFNFDLPEATVSNERYVLFSFANPFINLNDGLYTYQLKDENGVLEVGSMKIQTDDFGTSEVISYNNDDDEFIVYED